MTLLCISSARQGHQQLQETKALAIDKVLSMFTWRGVEREAAFMLKLYHCDYCALFSETSLNKSEFKWQILLQTFYRQFPVLKVHQHFSRHYVYEFPFLQLSFLFFFPLCYTVLCQCFFSFALQRNPQSLTKKYNLKYYVIIN